MSKPAKRERGAARPSKRALPISEDGMRTLATQINNLLARADAESLAADLSLSAYTRLAGVLVRLVEAGVKCEKHRSDEKRKKDVKTGLGQKGLSDIEEKLKLL